MGDQQINTGNNCTFYIVRHGETDWNVRQIIQGHQDSFLTPAGEEQAIALGKKLSHIHFDAVFSSDLIRTKRTAELITLEKNIAVQTTTALREKKYGTYEGKSVTEWREELKGSIEKFEKLSH